MIIYCLEFSLAVQSPRIIDGDTVALPLGETEEIVRLENIDTPERDRRVECDAERMPAETVLLPVSRKSNLTQSKGA